MPVLLSIYLDRSTEPPTPSATTTIKCCLPFFLVSRILEITSCSMLYGTSGTRIAEAPQLIPV